MPEVPRVNTPMDVTFAGRELVNALRTAGEEPNRDEAALLLAQLWIETGRGRSCNNNNPGNLSASARWAGDFFRPAWFTINATSSPQMLALNAAMLKGKAPSAFRSYDTPERGFADYALLLLHQFFPIVEAARSGDAMAMGAAIKSSGYTPDAPPGTGSSLLSLKREFFAAGLFSDLPLAGAAVPPSVPPSEPDSGSSPLPC